MNWPKKYRIALGIMSFIICLLLNACADGRNNPALSQEEGMVIEVHNTKELLASLGNDREILLTEEKFGLDSTLVLEGFSNLKIIGSANSELFVQGGSTATIEVYNCEGIRLENLLIGNPNVELNRWNGGTVILQNSDSILMQSCTIYGQNAIGLLVKKVKNFVFSNSEITSCKAFIFELEQSENCLFANSRFYDNHLKVSVLGGFTNGTREVTFSRCDFFSNIPDLIGNPAFNFNENYKDTTDKILFENCAFKNNKGYKWYGDKIELTNCQIDSSDFIGFDP